MKIFIIYLFNFIMKWDLKKVFVIIVILLILGVVVSVALVNIDKISILGKTP